MKKERITIIGAGLTGPLLSIFLARRGFEVEVFERRPDMRKQRISAGRSINLALSTRGIHALSQVGLSERILARSIPMHGRLMHSRDGEFSFHKYSSDDSEYINAISRGELNRHLMDEAENAHGVVFHFDQECVGIDRESGEATFADTQTGAKAVHDSRVVLATDGSASVIRADLLRGREHSLSIESLTHGYKELLFPAGENGTFMMEKNALHIWPRGRFMLIALPNFDGSFTGTLFFPVTGHPSFESLVQEEEVQTFFAAEFPDAVPLMPTLVQDFFANPTGKLATVRCKPWYFTDKVCLLGDAAHAVVPFFGQGMNCSFEDCTVFDDCVGKYGTDWQKVFAEFERLRKPEADAIAQMAVDNYFEMREHVADPSFLLKKEIEFALEQRYGERFTPRYTMVTFRRMPYSQAQSRGEIQNDILHQLAGSVDHVDKLDWDIVDSLLSKYGL